METCKNETLQVLEQHQQDRSKCLVYTRVMGYHRPIESFNIGKQGEHKQRTLFKERNDKTDL
ncbi:MULTISPECIES: anaerobic ribonucleoside-triphosphate reductase [unclassified Sphingobacterium]|uniref:anaerobic ribonucleoside-triphosphate reductase n=1 Tax=unclassified Sphingobacterium TaxID=2609468 RepID=UPI00142FA29F|nr:MULTISPECIES: anaerobic ribonucleoside-triphosphate reductase [unclassified Sphingobacterium]